MSYREVDGRVHIELTREEYGLLNMALGAAASTEMGWGRDFIRLANTINDGNPNWTPYILEEEKK